MLETLFRRFPLIRVFYKGILNQAFRLLHRGEGVRVMEEEWDNLIILDGCRYDYFREYNWIKGKLERRISLGSHTEEWVKKNFQGDYPDTVYVSGNPYISEVKLMEFFGKVPFHHLEEVWSYRWDENAGTVRPESITSAALAAQKKYPNKRLIMHYMQPHWPFLSAPELSRARLRSKKLRPIQMNLGWKLLQKLAERYPDFSLALKKRTRKEGGNVWDHARQGRIDIEKIRKAYVKDIRIVLKEVESLLKDLDGKSVVTSDHGNLFGEHWIYGHPAGFRFKELVEVPWLKVEGRLEERERFTINIELRADKN